MKLRLENPLIFAKAIDLISELVMEVKIKLNEFGLSIVAIDPANVSMLRLIVPKSAFKEFEADDEVLGVNIENLKKILKRTTKTGDLIMERKENTLEIKIEDKIKRTFNLSLIEIDAEDKEFPNHLEFSSKIKLSSEDFVDSIEDCSVVSDSCSFKVKEGIFIIESRGHSSARAEFGEEVAEIEAENSHSRYSLDYLQKFAKASKNFEKTLIKFATDHPLRIDFNSEHLSLSFILAPRIETDD